MSDNQMTSYLSITRPFSFPSIFFFSFQQRSSRDFFILDFFFLLPIRSTSYAFFFLFISLTCRPRLSFFLHFLLQTKKTYLMSHNSSELVCRDDPNGTTLQGVCEISEIGGVGRPGSGAVNGDMRQKGVAAR
jgi:hypothetical protein